jgi:hypothetical protein
MRLRTAILAITCAMACSADTLTLRDGQVVHGIYMGGTARTIKIQVDDTVKTYDVTDVSTLQFTSPAPNASAPVPPRRGQSGASAPKDSEDSRDRK